MQYVWARVRSVTRGQVLTRICGFLTATLLTRRVLAHWQRLLRYRGMARAALAPMARLADYQVPHSPPLPPADAHTNLTVPH